MSELMEMLLEARKERDGLRARVAELEARVVKLEQQIEQRRLDDLPGVYMGGLDD